MDAHVHITGNVGGDVDFRSTKVSLATFRLACTPRIRKNGDWVDGDTTWLTVTCWRNLAENVATSVKKGDAVVVVGKLRTSNFRRDDGSVLSRLTLDATSVGHDMGRGTSVFRRNERQVPDDSERDADLELSLTAVESQGSDPEETEDRAAA